MRRKNHVRNLVFFPRWWTKLYKEIRDLQSTYKQLEQQYLVRNRLHKEHFLARGDAVYALGPALQEWIVEVHVPIYL
jgi:hypothetical protein